jgi:hypothetical protein
VDDDAPAEPDAFVAGDADVTEAQPVCPHCLAPIHPYDNFCSACNAPVSAIAAMDPLASVYAEGRAYQNATTGRPRLIVLLGVWLIFGPALLVTLWFAGKSLLPQQHVTYRPAAVDIDHDGQVDFQMMTESDRRTVWFDASRLITAALALGISALPLLILFKITRNYLHHPPDTDANRPTDDTPE